MKWIIAVLIVASNSVFGQSQSPVEIGSSDGYQIAVTVGNANQRVGNAVLVRVMGISSNLPTLSNSRTVLVACDGSWVTTGIQSAYRLNQKLNFAEVEQYGRSEEVPVPLGIVEFQSTGETPLFYGRVLARKASQICKSAGREPRNVLIPVATYDDKDDTYASIALVLGTSVKRGDVIDIWTRKTWYKVVPTLGENGRPVESFGQIVKTPQLIGKHKLDRTAYDCRNRTSATYESASYEPGSPEPETKSVQRDNIRFSSVIPGTVGEQELEAVCRLYAAHR